MKPTILTTDAVRTRWRLSNFLAYQKIELQRYEEHWLSLQV